MKREMFFQCDKYGFLRFMFNEIVDTRNKKVLFLTLLSIVIAIIYSPVLNNDFLTNWDDQWMVTGNPHLYEVTHLNTLSFDAVATSFSEPYGGQYSPVNTLVYMMIVRAVGMEPFGFQLTFLLLHILNFLLVGLLLQKLMIMIPGLELSDKYRFAISWGVAFLFAIHPMQVEAVAWISASKVVLYSFFYLMGLWFYLKYRSSGKYLWLVIVFLCFITSFLAKEQAIVFVVSLVLVDLVVCKSLKEKVLWLEKIPFAGLPSSLAGLPFRSRDRPVWVVAIHWDRECCLPTTVFGNI